VVVAPPQGKGIRHFPGRVDSANKAQLSFRVNGKLDQLLVTAGESVNQGQLLAQLDQADFQIAVRERQAIWDRADKDFTRAEDLVGKGAISRRDYDEVEANFKTAAVALDAAKLNLQYTRLSAPFEGNIAERFIERFEEVTLNQPVFSLMDPTALQVEIDLPESLVLLLRSEPAEQDRQQAPVWATFDSVSDKRFDLTFKEITTRADKNTQTFRVTLLLDAPKDILVLPGMTASVTVDFSETLHETSVHYIPVSAVTADPELGAIIWLVDEQTMTVHEQRIELGRMAGASVAVISGVTEGQRIVTAGSAYLAEGMQVTLMETKEQAISRSDDV
jgi:RND family efflux transporter MFP subunit